VGYWPWFLKRTLGINPLQYALSSWVRPWISIAPFALLTYVIEQKWPARNLAIFFSQVAVALPVALVAIWFGCVDKKHREKYLEGFTQFVARVFLRG